MKQLTPFLTFLVTLVVMFVGDINAKNKSISQQNFNSLQRELPAAQFPARLSKYSAPNTETAWIEQRVDHFNQTDLRTWSMRYLRNNQFHQEGGPLFIFVGAEWPISEKYLNSGHMYDMAREHNGYLAYTEHRYIGKSKPTSDLFIENLKYLDVRQALADLAHFVRTIKTTIVPGMTDSKVILVGLSYSAAMAIWFKRLYPDVATGAWASSPILLGKVNFFEFKEVMGQSISLVGGKKCEQRIRSGIAEMEEMIAAGRGAELNEKFKICDNFDYENDLDISTLFYEISEAFAATVQYHDGYQIQQACKVIMRGEDNLSGLAKYLIKSMINSWYDARCLDLTYKFQIGRFNYTSYNYYNVIRQWTYMTCNAHGWFQNSESRKQPFGTKFPVTYFIKMCADLFGAQFTRDYVEKQVENANKLLGGLSPNVENVYMTHGQLDPWRMVAIQNGTQTTVIPMYSHSNDLDSISSSDSVEMRASKERISSLVREWLTVSGEH